MRTKIFLATVAAALLAASAAFAGNGPAKAHGMHYSFLGQLTATPANGGVSITVVGGTRAALRAMLGQPVTQTFAYGADTEFLKWANGVPDDRAGRRPRRRRLRAGERQRAARRDARRDRAAALRSRR